MIKPSRPPHAQHKPLWHGLSHILVTLLYVLGLTVVFGLFTTIGTDGGTRTVPYTEFKQWLRADKNATVSAIGAHRVALNEIRRRLLEHEVVNGDEVRKLLPAGTENAADAA
jgi:hypothetical protein